MATLQELIDNGLQVGQLARNERGSILQLHVSEIKLWYLPKYQCYTGSNALYYLDSTFEPTTAYDSDIDPDLLPVPEPFATGWVVFLGAKYEVQSISKLNNRVVLKNETIQPLLSDCCPCLPPL